MMVTFAATRNCLTRDSLQERSWTVATATRQRSESSSPSFAGFSGVSFLAPRAWTNVALDLPRRQLVFVLSETITRSSRDIGKHARRISVNLVRREAHGVRQLRADGRDAVGYVRSP